MEQFKPVTVNVTGKYIDNYGVHYKTYIVAFCGCCGNPIKPSIYQKWCRWCGSKIDIEHTPKGNYTIKEKFINQALTRL